MKQENVEIVQKHIPFLEKIIRTESIPGSNMHVWKELNSVYKDEYPKAPPVNLNCPACLFHDLITTIWNDYQRTVNTNKNVKTAVKTESKKRGNPNFGKKNGTA